MKAGNWSPGTAAHLSIVTSIPSARRRSASARIHSRWSSSSQEYEMNADFMALSLPALCVDTVPPASSVLSMLGWVAPPNAGTLSCERTSELDLDFCRRTLLLHIFHS